MSSSEKVAQVKAIIATSGAKIMSITFTKANGDTRKMSFNPKTAKGLVGNKASDSAKQAVATRKANNPHLVSVCDQNLLARGDEANRCWRSINCETVTEIRVGGQEILYAN